MRIDQYPQATEVKSGDRFVVLADPATDPKMKTVDLVNLPTIFTLAGFTVAITRAALATTDTLLQAFGKIQKYLTFDSVPTTSSDNLLTSGAIKTALDAKIGSDPPQGACTVTNLYIENGNLNVEYEDVPIP
jgi:hypothetical protein